MKNKYLLGLLTVALVCALGYGGFQIKRRCDLTEYYITQSEKVYFDTYLGASQLAKDGFQRLEAQMREDGYSRAEINEIFNKAFKKAIADREAWRKSE